MNRKLWILLAAAAVLIAVLCCLMPKPNQESSPAQSGIPGLTDSDSDNAPQASQDSEAPAAGTAPDSPETTGPEQTAPEGSAPADPEHASHAATTEAASPAHTQPNDDPADSDTPDQSAHTTSPTEPGNPAETEPEEPVASMDYEQFTALSGAEQREYMESFESIDAFFAWYNAAREQYQKDHPSMDVGDGEFDFGEDFG